MVLGLIVLSAQIFTTVVSVLFLGFTLLIGGIAQFFYGFFSGSWSKFFLSLLGGSVAAVAGALLITSPALSAATLTLIIGVFLLIGGLYRIVSSVAVRYSQWGWYFTGGVISLLLGVSLLVGWPYAGLWFIGLYIGIELFVTGFMLTITAYGPSEAENATYATPHETTYLSGAKGGKATKKRDPEHDYYR